MKRKGEVQQVFIYLMVIIVVGAVFLLGYSMITKIMEKQCDVERVTFVKELESNLEKYSSRGYSNTVEIKAPCDYELLCFVKSKVEYANPDDIDSIPFSVIKQLVKLGDSQNVFLIKDGYVEPLLASDVVSVSSIDNSGLLCFKPRFNKFSIKMLGAKGGLVEISAGGQESVMSTSEIKHKFQKLN